LAEQRFPKPHAQGSSPCSPDARFLLHVHKGLLAGRLFKILDCVLSPSAIGFTLRRAPYSGPSPGWQEARLPVGHRLAMLGSSHPIFLFLEATCGERIFFLPKGKKEEVNLSAEGGTISEEEKG
jgi:hypothetical protein